MYKGGYVARKNFFGKKLMIISAFALVIACVGVAIGFAPHSSSTKVAFASNHDFGFVVPTFHWGNVIGQYEWMSTGDGTVENPYQIRTESDFLGIRELLARLTEEEFDEIAGHDWIRPNHFGTSFEGKHFRLMNNLDFTIGVWDSMSTRGRNVSFAGIFDGNGHTVRLPNVIEPCWNGNAGLFGNTNGAIIQNLVIAGNVRLIRPATLDNDGTIYTFEPRTAGAIVGSSSFTVIRNVRSEVNWVMQSQSLDALGGIVGDALETYLLAVSNYGMIDLDLVDINSVGGLVGEVSFFNWHSRIANSYNVAQITVSGQENARVAGIVGTLVTESEFSPGEWGNWLPTSRVVEMTNVFNAGAINHTSRAQLMAFGTANPLFIPVVPNTNYQFPYEIRLMNVFVMEMPQFTGSPFWGGYNGPVSRDFVRLGIYNTDGQVIHIGNYFDFDYEDMDDYIIQINPLENETFYHGTLVEFISEGMIFLQRGFYHEGEFIVGEYEFIQNNNHVWGIMAGQQGFLPRLFGLVNNPGFATITLHTAGIYTGFDDPELPPVADVHGFELHIHVFVGHTGGTLDLGTDIPTIFSNVMGSEVQGWARTRGLADAGRYLFVGGQQITIMPDGTIMGTAGDNTPDGVKELFAVWSAVEPDDLSPDLPEPCVGDECYADYRPDQEPSGNNLLWVYIALGVFGGLAIIGAVVYFVLLKKGQSSRKTGSDRVVAKS